MASEDHLHNAANLYASKAGWSVCNPDFLIVQSPKILVSGFDITKVALTGENNQTICSDMLRVNDTQLSKDNLHNAEKLHPSKT